eukprot:6214040-Pleurochrysis_carterae.AAC.1
MRDNYNNVKVSNNGLSLQLLASFGELTVTASCDTNRLIDPRKFYMQHCHIPHLPSSWFAESGQVSVQVRATYTHYSFISLPEIVSITARPPWFGALANVASRAGSFAALPASPLYEYEEFDVYTFSHTGDFALETWWIFVDIDARFLEFVSFTQNDKFNGVSFTLHELEEDRVRLSFNAVGTKGTTNSEDVTGNAVALVTIKLRFVKDVAGGSYSNLLSIHTKQFINPGSNPFVVDAPGVILDSTSGLNGKETGSITVRRVYEIALFAFTKTGTLANLASFTGNEDVYPITVVTTNDDDRVSFLGDSLVQGANCSTQTNTSILTLSECTAIITINQTEGLELGTLHVNYNGLETEFSFT